MIRKALAIAALVFAPMALSQHAVSAANIEIEATGPVIELRVSQNVEAEPDMVTIGAAVTSEAPTSVEALRLNSTEMRRVVDRIRQLGVASKDIQTSRINLRRRYDYNRETRKNEFKGYVASNSVTVHLREIEETGEVIDALVVAGVTDLSGPTFGLEDDTEAKTAARAQALEIAMDRAREYAAMLGFDGYRVLEINEAIYGSMPAAMPRRAMMAAQAEVADVAPVEPGLVSTGVSLTIKFELVNED